ncbi:MAG TPA: alpha/beta fold hydrolase [Rhizomicrobium sp.]|jgi:pimeloyl-ACP methyl ester carboxylesterase|nr:alpha/beta fold hydrolase [Rhizomicrobium sp.]
MALFASAGLKIAYDDIGPREGRPVVLVHGFATNRGECWRRLGWYGAFERKAIRCVALDCRGHGESDKPSDPALYGRANMAGDVLALLDHLQINRADILGYSMGARIAMTAALAAPHRVALLILGGVGGRLFEPRSPVDELAQAMEHPDPEAIANPLLQSFRRFADEQGEDRFALAALARARDVPLTKADVAKIAAETLVVTGARDALAGDPRALAEAIPGARAVTVPGCDHFSLVAHALFKASAFDFLDGTLE